MDDRQKRAEEALAQVWSQSGHALDTSQIETTLKSLLPDCPREVHILSTAHRQNIHAEVQNAPAHQAGTLAEKLADTTGIELSLARWAVLAWAAALNSSASGQVAPSANPAALVSAPPITPVAAPLQIAPVPIGPLSWLEMACLRGHTSDVKSVAFSPDGRLLASGSSDSIRLWDPSSGVQVGPGLSGHADGARSVAFSPDGGRLVSAGNDQTVLVWDLASQRHDVCFVQPANRAILNFAAFSPDGSLVAYLTHKGQFGRICLQDWTTKKVTRELGGFFDGLSDPEGGFAFSPNGRFLAACQNGGSFRLWDLWSKGRARFVEHELKGHEVSCLAFSPDSRILACGSQDQTISLWNPDSCKLLRQLRISLRNGIKCLAFSPDLRLLATGCGHSITLWGAPSPDWTGERPGLPDVELYDSGGRRVFCLAQAHRILEP